MAAVATLPGTASALLARTFTSAGATSGWSIETAAQPSIRNGTISSVSCPSASDCTAVGSYYSGNGSEFTLAEGWNGSSWTIQPTPVPSGATKSLFSAVSCATTGLCTAVGSYTKGSDEWTLAEGWNGTEWSIQTTPAMTTADPVRFTGVSCTGAAVCTAVGSAFEFSIGAERPLVEVRNGASWIVEAAPDPAGATASLLSGVSCVAANVCTAVGSSFNSAGAQMTLGETSSGSGWVVQATPDVSGATASLLSGVSCVAANVCTAVGSSFDSAGAQMTLGETSSGSGWVVQATPDVSGATASLLSGVSCVAANVCTAVGSSFDSAGAQMTLGETRSGSGWVVQATPDVSGATASLLSGVSCVAANVCTAVGSSFDRAGTQLALDETNKGAGWTIGKVANPLGAYFSRLLAVSCAAPTACMAVGSSFDFSTGSHLTLAELWDGSNWTVEATPDPTGATASVLSGVSCTSPTDCIAVGSAYDSTGIQVTLAERWDGRRWTVENSPPPLGASRSLLTGVSCATPTACTAVGSYENGRSLWVTLTESWNGFKWTKHTTPDPSGATYSQLSGVSCLSATACTAVGFYTSRAKVSGTLAEVWNGTNWAIAASPNPNGSTYNQLSGVSCATVAFCIAVGYDTNGGSVPVTLAEVWNGAAWSIMSTPNPTGSLSSYLSGVSCPTTSSCTAVGSDVNSIPLQATQASVWDGTRWTLQATPNPTAALSSQLSGVSCPTTTTACIAVGYSSVGPLAEGYTA